MYGAVGTLVVATILHLEERACAIGRGVGRKEACDILRTTAIYLCLGIWSKLLDALKEVALIVVAEYDINTLDGGYVVGLELRVTPCDSDYCIGITAMYLADYITAFFIGVFGYRAAVDYCYVARLRWLYAQVSTALKLAR